MRVVTAVAGLLGGLCWMAAPWTLDPAPLGALLLAVAVLGAGAGLVSRSAGWLRVVVAVCFLALVGSVLQVLRDNLDEELVLVCAGGAAAIAALVALARRPARPAPPRTPPGSRPGKRSRGRSRSRSRGVHAA